MCVCVCLVTDIRGLILIQSKEKELRTLVGENAQRLHLAPKYLTFFNNLNTDECVYSPGEESVKVFKILEIICDHET